MPIVRIRGKAFEVELATTPQEWEAWLAGRNEILFDRGMLFAFDPPRIVPIWMKGVKFPLDVLWIGDGWKINHTASLSEEKNGRFQEETPPFPAWLVLELSGGTIRELGIRVGDQIEIQNVVF